MRSDSQDEGLLSRVRDWFVTGALAFTGFYVVLARALGASEEEHGGVLRLAVSALCFFSAFQWFLLSRARRDLRRVRDLLTDVLFGAGTKRDREAVDILVRALRAPDARARDAALRTLRKISGMDLGAEPRPWEEWWQVSRATFTRASPAPKK